MRAARVTVQTLLALAAKRLSQAQAQRLEARLEDRSIWEQRRLRSPRTEQRPTPTLWPPGEKEEKQGTFT
jgi:hypothetical protein